MAASQQKYPPGEYVVTVDRLRKEIFADDDKARKEPIDEEIYEKGEEVTLDARNATRLANSASVAKPNTLEAKVAKGQVPAAFVPNPGLTDEQLRTQVEAIQQVLAERQADVSYDRTAEGGIDPTDPEAVKQATGKAAAKQAKVANQTPSSNK